MKNPILILLTLSSFLCSSQNDKPQRSAFTLKLAVDSVQFYEQEIKASPYLVKEKVLQLYPGEKIFIEVETNKTGIVSMKTVSENKFPEKTLIVELTQRTKNKKHEYMMLEINNPFKKELKYKAMMYIVGHNKWIPTNVLPVKYQGAYETWSDIIITLVLSDWEFL